MTGDICGEVSVCCMYELNLVVWMEWLVMFVLKCLSCHVYELIFVEWSISDDSVCGVVVSCMN